MIVIHDKIILKINNEIGANVNDLHKSKNLVESFKNDLRNIEAKLNPENNLVQSQVKDILKANKAAKDKIENNINNVTKYEKELILQIKKHDKLLTDVSDDLNKIRQLENLMIYFRILQDIQDVSIELQSCIKGRDETKTVSFFLSLCGDTFTSNTIIARLDNVNAPNLKSFAFKTITYWHGILNEKFSKDFENVLKTMKWPHLGQGIETFNPHKDCINRITVLAEYLFLIKLPSDNEKLFKITKSLALPELSIPIQLLIKPFRQRFQYHFTGQKQTNRLDKPEWYFTQILTWAKDNHLFINETFQKAANKAKLHNFNIRIEFIRGLVQFGIEKLCLDIEEINNDETLFAHLLDEILSFEQELKDNLAYPNNYPSAITVLTQPQYLLKWILIEEKFSKDKMDAMLTKGTPWEFLDPINVEDLKIPKCSDQFIRLLDAIRERYCCLPQPGHQLQFLHLQLELIENFRCRLVQLHNSPIDNVSTTKILNAINYLNSVLREWGENVHYLHLHAALIGPHADEISSVFDKSITELDHWQTKLIRELSSKIVDDIKAKSMSYRHDMWVTMPEQNSKEPFMLSVTAGEMFQLMVTNLHNLDIELSKNIFTIALRLIAKTLDEFFIESMLMNTRFSKGGAAQFQYDMTRNLFALFGQYVRRPSLLFKNINDACILLTLPTGSAILLYQTLVDKNTNNEENQSLKEIGISNASVNMAMNILKRRTDICT